MNDIMKDIQYIKFGTEYLGPFLYSYMSWLYDQIVASGIQKVFFFARDGYLMEKGFQLFLEWKKKDIKTQYVYFSRKSIRQTMLWRCASYCESLRYMSTSRFISIGGILEYWGFSEEKRKRIAQEYDIDLNEEHLTNGLLDNTKIKALYEKLKYQIDAESCKQDELLYQYIEQIGMKDRCAIVDIGWHGRMQYYIEQFFKAHNIPLKCSGYYLGIQNTVPLNGKTKGFLYDDGKPRLRKAVQAFLGGYEKLFQSSEGSTYGYRAENRRIIPVLGPYEYKEQVQNQERISAWQDAALDYVKQALREQKPADISMAMPLVHIGQYPSMKDVQLFSFLCNDDGKKTYFVSQKSLWQYRPKELIYALSNSAWKTGFMKSVFKLPLPYYWIYSVMRK